MSMSKRNIIWLLMAFFFIADLAAAVHKGRKKWFCPNRACVIK